jgi:hypothetical protein
MYIYVCMYVGVCVRAYKLATDIKKKNVNGREGLEAAYRGRRGLEGGRKRALRAAQYQKKKRARP